MIKVSTLTDDSFGRPPFGKLGDFTAIAVAGGAKLVVFPEAYGGGYPKGLDFGALHIGVLLGGAGPSVVGRQRNPGRGGE
jgi:hypothetical protein